MSEFPSHWDFKCIGDFASRVRRKNSGGECQDPLTISAVDGLVSQRDYFNKIVASKNTENYTLLRKNEFAYNKSYSDGYPVGAARRLKTKDRGIVSPLYICFELDRNQIDLQFADYLLDSDWFVQAIFGIAKEGARSHGLLNIGIDEFFSALLPIPPLPEQKKIAEILSGIDMRIKLGEQRISQLEVLLMSAGAKFFGPDSCQSTKTIGEMFEVSSGSTPSRGRQDYFCSHGGTPWVKTMDLNDELVTTTDEQITNAAIHEGRARVFPKGTLLLAMYGGWNQIGRTGILGQNSSCNQAMSALLPSAEVSPGFLNLQLVIRRSYWKSVAASSRKDPNITKSDVQNMPIIVPSLAKQQKVKEALGSIIESAKKERAYISSLQLLKSSLSSDLLSGRKRVSV